VTSELPPLRERLVKLDGVNLCVRIAGVDGSPVVLLLHGFPEFWYGWRHQIGALVHAGYQVVIPDQRGYGQSDKPPGVESYALSALVGDVVALLDRLGVERASLVGHDWGGVVAFAFAAQHPERVSKLAVLNAPHPGVFAKAVRAFPQLRRSWYIGLFQIPALPEWGLSLRNYAALERAMVRASRAGVHSQRDLALYREAWGREGALKAMVHWYRAAARAKPPAGSDKTIDVPTLVVWGDRDAALGRELADASIARCSQGQLLRLPDAGHFVQHDAPDAVNTALIDFLGRHPERKAWRPRQW
jgi:pimeloyl-ACP methyl ester carboxylesterase